MIATVNTGTVLIGKKKLLEKVPLCARAIDKLEKKGDFPKRVALTSRNVAWDLAAVDAWIEARRASGAKAKIPATRACES